jgi:anti-sigma factor RsiW
MNTIEEKLWNYIDGTCTPAEQEAIARFIEHDEMYKQKYTELLELNQEFAAMELDEPSMAFSYNVMEAIRADQALAPLKSTINKKIILGIAAFFVFTILAMLAFILSSVQISGNPLNLVNIKLPAEFKLPAASTIFNSAFMKSFFVFDVILALFLTDSYLRRKKAAKEA